ncbi:MAG TPA: 3-dehydroquinate synthase [Bacteroidetes bacterium]|nr:3-dehydroquinate synthase [Bacteroidota bacterium]
MQSLKVNLPGNRSYPIYVGTGCLDKLGEMLRLYMKTSKFILITDEQVASHYSGVFLPSFEKAKLHLDTIVVPAGEQTKNIETYHDLMTRFLELGAARDWAVIAFGGGVVGDLAGFAAATYMRGIPFVQVPTTLLAQVDASVGGKTGINHPRAKNIIGAFHQPALVWIDLAVLRTLGQRDLISGLAEVIKYGIIHDRDFFAFCEKNRTLLLEKDEHVLSDAVLRSCAIKADIVARDEREHSVRAFLNFGHTIGHALENLGGYERIRHGEAVFLGMLAEARLSTQLGLLSQTEYQRIERLLRQIPLQAVIEGIEPDRVMEVMRHDKKVQAGRLRYVLPISIGEMHIIEEPDPGLVREAVLHVLNDGWVCR